MFQLELNIYIYIYIYVYCSDDFVLGFYLGFCDIVTDRSAQLKKLAAIRQHASLHEVVSRDERSQSVSQSVIVHRCEIE